MELLRHLPLIRGNTAYGAPRMRLALPEMQGGITTTRCWRPLRTRGHVAYSPEPNYRALSHIVGLAAHERPRRSARVCFCWEMHSQLSGGKTKTQGAGAEQNHCPQEVYSSGYQPGQRGVRRATRGSPSSRHARSPCSHTLNYLQVTALPSPAHAFKCSIHGTIRCRRITPQDRFSPYGGFSRLNAARAPYSA
ncbi:hypothetical protein L227DRAFT_331348 [Lentinus tigrinus ALCF2SS1-6]|uniref:Uncharacterized protein n=1 Tax=Lentinus tigrinus ALCF2SS1-6 TaxID=1328759 RepID=A0A5C2SLA2_9APHY|nr:hypothetical protein L227DRAFT_331348 [Lentinus tigrinus ALCF2SS1-6]